MRAPLHRFISSYLLPALLISVAFLGQVIAQESPSAPPQSASTEISPKDDPDRRHAIELLELGKTVEALPLFEKLCAQYPKDNGLWEGWGVATLGYSQTLTDRDLRKKTRARARSLLVTAKELGDNSNLLQVLLGMIPEDGGDNAYSPRKEVDEVMQHAEADFSRGDYDKARDGYLHALLLEPTNYEAALFMGDVYFKQHVNGSAGEWFARATEIDPNRETAYRYWGDSLSAMGKNAEARDKYIEAIVADPYNNRSWVGLTQWVQRTKLNLNWVRLQDKSAVAQKDATHINITLDPGSGKSDPNAAAWVAYAMERALWHGDKFKKEFPTEPKYRHTMREEAESLHLLVAVLTEQKDFHKKNKDLDQSLLQLVQIDKAGFTEPFALLNRADNEIALDYAPYRSAHRDTLYRYFDEFVVPKTPPQ